MGRHPRYHDFVHNLSNVEHARHCATLASPKCEEGVGILKHFLYWELRLLIIF